MRSVIVALVCCTVISGLSACTTTPEQPSAKPTATAPTPLHELDTARVGVARATFCALVAPAEVETALGGSPTRETSWGNGDRLPGGRPGDVSHEFGCRWTRGSRSAAAWVYAPPVTRARAHELSRARLGTTCRPWRHAPAYGRPSSGEACTLDGGARIVGLHGLFGDAWLSCGLVVATRAARSDKQLPDRASRWCAAVLAAAAS